MKIIKVNPLKVIPAPWNTRSEITDEGIRSLAESIKADGIIQMPNCIKDEDGDLICYDGNRRVAAACQIGLDEIEVAVNDITEDEAKVKTVTANLQREDDDPLLAANVIAGLGGDPEIIASKLGKTVSWVKRRAKLNALSDEIKAFVGKVTLEVLERVSDLSTNDQKKLAKSLEHRVIWANGNPLKWSEVKRDVDAMTADLDEAHFDTAECVGCSERTGADWFADATDKLGRCINCKCFKAKVKAWEDAEIAAEIPADAEKVRVDYEWQMPWEIREKDTRDKRDKKHPCAWYWFDGGKLTVKWAMSQKQIDAKREAEEAEREAERKANAADHKRDNEIGDKLHDYLESEEGQAEAEYMTRKMLGGDNSEAADMVVAAFVDWLNSWHDDYCDIIRNFPELATKAGIASEDIVWYLEYNKEDEEEITETEEDGE